MAQKSVKAEFCPQVTDGLLHMKAYSKEMLTKLIIYKCNCIFLSLSEINQSQCSFNTT